MRILFNNKQVHPVPEVVGVDEILVREEHINDWVRDPRSGN